MENEFYLVHEMCLIQEDESTYLNDISGFQKASYITDNDYTALTENG